MCDRMLATLATLAMLDAMLLGATSVDVVYFGLLGSATLVYGYCRGFLNNLIPWVLICDLQ